MKKFYFLTLFAFISLFANAQSYQWAKGIGGTGYEYCNHAVIDGSGNLYMTGSFTSTADFNPGTGTANLTSVGQEDIFIAKYDANGNYLWAKRIGSTNPDMGYGIAVDGAGNCYVTGTFELTVDFDPGAGTANLTSGGQEDIFIAKYDANGNYIWAKSMGSSGQDYGNCIILDGTGNCYLTGYFQGTVDFDPGVGTANLISNSGSNDIFFAKYDASGNYIWAKSIGSNNPDNGYGIAVDGTGNLYITGSFSSTADFDPGAGTANLTSNSSACDIFFAKYDASGNYIWAKILVVPVV
jgi:phage-related tail fiber protein